jgi:hypothetical protein
MGISPYPRRGQRLAPTVLTDLLPKTFLLRRLRGKTLRVRRDELDERAWQRFTPAECEALAVEVVEEVRRLLAVLCPALLGLRVPRPAAGVGLDDLELETRTRNCLLGAGLTGDMSSLGGRTVGELVDALHYFGAKSLVDLLAALEGSRPPAPGQPRTAVPSSLVPSAPAPEPAVEAPAASLEEEILRHFVPRGKTTDEGHERNRQLFARFHGLFGPRVTLQQLAAESGVTRQRVSQICKLRPVQRGGPEAAPLLVRALALVASRVPQDADVLAKELVRQGLAARPVSLQALAELAPSLGLKVRFAMLDLGGCPVAVAPGREAELAQLSRRARRAVGRAGAAAVAAVAAPVEPAVAARLLHTLPGFRWLDQPGAWFRIATKGPPRILAWARQVLSVAGRLSAPELRTALRRSRPTEAALPPPAVLLAVCREAPGLRVDGDFVVADPPLDWRQELRGEVREVVRILHEHGPLMDCADLEVYRARAGIPRATFYQCLSRLPVVRRYGPSLYGLRGADITPGMVEAAREGVRRAEKKSCHWHWLADGRLELRCVLSLGAVCSGALPLPPRMGRHVQGQFAYRTEEGQAGTVKVAGSFCWGFSRVFRREGADVGDPFRLTLDLTARRAEVELSRRAAIVPGLQDTFCV